MAIHEKEEENYKNLVRAVFLLQSDQPTEPVDTVYLHGLSKGMIYSTQPNLFETAVNLVNSKKSRFITFNGSDGEGMPPQNQPGAAWPGKDWYLEEFKDLSIDTLLLFPTGPGLHTRDEADKFILLAKEFGWSSTAILSVGYHSVRSMSCMVAAMETNNYFLEAHFIIPSTTDAWSPMLGSQGLSITDTFTEIGEKEIPNVLKYWERGGANPPNSWRSGYAVPPEYLFHYLQYRREIVDQQRFPLFPLETPAIS